MGLFVTFRSILSSFVLAYADFLIPFPDLGFVTGKIPNAFGLAINEPRKITV